MRKYLFLIFCALFTDLLSSNILAQTITSYAITTYAGTTGGYSGDGGPATNAKIIPYGIALDATGNLYIADVGGSAIRKVDGATHIISTIAGNGTPGATGDGGPATAALLQYPKGIIVDNMGNIIFADQNNHVIRMINPAGIISTIAGNYVAGVGGDGGPASAATLNYPCGLAIDKHNNIYYFEQNHYVRKISASTGIITKIAGIGATGYTGDGASALFASISGYDIAVDSTGSVYISDGLSRIRKIDPAGIITTIAGGITIGYGGDGGPATAAQLDRPRGMCFDAAQNLYIAESHIGRIRKISPAGVISTVVSGGAWQPICVTPDNFGNIYVSEGYLDRVWYMAIPTYPPAFTGGSPQSLTVCESSGTNSINPLMAVVDSSLGRTLTWSASSAPAHGTILAGYTTTSTGGTVTPTGLNYTPAPGYTGTDAFSVQISDGTNVVTTTINVTINPAPSAGTISGLSSVCVGGSSITLTDATTGGTWSASNGHAIVSGGMVTAVSAGLDTIRYSVSNSCGTATATQIVTVNTIPSAGTITGASVVCIGSSISLSDVAPSGAWTSSNANATVTSAGSVFGMAAGTVTISYSVTNSCGITNATHVVTVSAAPSAGTVSGMGTVCVGASITLTDAVTGGSWTRTNTTASVSAGGLVSGVSSGIDTIMYTVSNICGSAIASKTITINPLPVAGTISGASNVCIGSSITLTDAVPSGIWTSSSSVATASAGGLVTGVSAGVDTIKYSVTNGCGTAIATYLITVSAIPSVGAVTGPDTVCTGNSITLTDATAGGTWSSNNAFATVSAVGVVTGMSSGIDTIVYTVTNACGSASATLVVNILPVTACGTTSLNTISEQEEVNVYPNPSTGTFTLIVNTRTNTEASVTITNVLGKKIKEFVLDANKATNVTINAAGGIYFLSVLTTSGCSNKTIIINR